MWFKWNRELIELNLLGKVIVSDRLQVHMLVRNKSMAKHVHTRLTLLKYDIADQRLKIPIRRFHIHKDNFVEDGTEALNLNPNRPANLGLIVS